MGYMGFGLQKWIYTQKPRKAFSRDRKNIGDGIYTHSTKNLNISGRSIQDVEVINERIAANRKRFNAKRIENRIFNLLTALVALIVLIFVLSQFFFTDNSPVHSAQRNPKANKIQLANLAFEYADNYLNNGDYDLAIKEFNTVLSIDSANKEARKGLARTYYMSCFEHSLNCDLAIKQYSILISMDSTMSFFKARAELYIHSGEIELAEKDLEIIENHNKTVNKPAE